MNSLVPQHRPSNWLAGAAGFSPEDQSALERALDDLERRSFAARLTGVLQQQLDIIGVIVPARFSAIANNAAASAIKAALFVALRSLDGKPLRDRRRLHKQLAALAGGAGGALGLSALPIELPVTTAIILRSIADIARGEGEDLADPATAFACLAVLGLGNSASPTLAHRARDDGEAIFETGYFATRAILAQSVTDAGRFFLGRSASIDTAPALARLVSQVASRFGITASQKFAAQAVPVIGAAAGAAVNLAFIDHFQTIARGHFTILRLERRYGFAMVHAEYDRMLQARPA